MSQPARHLSLSDQSTANATGGNEPQENPQLRQDDRGHISALHRPIALLSFS